MPPAPSAAPSAGYLGPEGTFSEEALLGSASAGAVTPVALETIRDAVMAVQERTVEWSLVPIENSIEGSVTVTLDTLAGEASEVAIVGEVVLPVRHYLIAASPLELGQIETVVSHPHVPGQCTRFLHGPLAQRACRCGQLDGRGGATGERAQRRLVGRNRHKTGV